MLLPVKTTKATFTLQALLSNFDFFKFIYLPILMMYIHNYKRLVSSENMPVLSNSMHANIDMLLHHQQQKHFCETTYGLKMEKMNTLVGNVCITFCSGEQQATLALLHCCFATLLVFCQFVLL